MDVYKERTIKLMNENSFANYIKTMGKITLPDNNLNTLVLLKVKEFEEAAKQEIMKEAMDRKADQERRRYEQQ